MRAYRFLLAPHGVAHGQFRSDAEAQAHADRIGARGFYAILG